MSNISAGHDIAVLILYDQVPMSTSKACLRVCLQNTTGSLSDYDLFAVGTGIDDTDQIASEIMEIKVEEESKTPEDFIIRGTQESAMCPAEGGGPIILTNGNGSSCLYGVMSYVIENEEAKTCQRSADDQLTFSAVAMNVVAYSEFILDIIEEKWDKWRN
ncbi:uncharacterized protein LOC142350960 [Convolutriloba macropyga]|uniref:uncharacterized protein LOC142350960 n=1 Tax=Convolutriloba macropyga TaxID=536237 RepID=UPI003F51D530